MIRPLYKAHEPFMEAPQAYGYLGVVMYDDTEDKLQCHICGKWFDNLSSHIARTHDGTVRDYKLRYSLPLNNGLCSRRLSALRSKQAHRQIDAKDGYGRINLLCKRNKMMGPGLRKFKRHKANYSRSPNTSIAAKNKVGLCDAQMRARWEVVKKIVGHDPNQPDLLKYDRRLLGGISAGRHRTINGYRKYIGVQTSPGRNPPKQLIEIAAALRKCHVSLGRVPSARDFRRRRDGKTACWLWGCDAQTVYNHFGGWGQALSYAGIRRGA